MRDVSIKIAAAVMKAAKEEGSSTAEYENDLEAQIRRGEFIVRCVPIILFSTCKNLAMWTPVYVPLKLAKDENTLYSPEVHSARRPGEIGGDRLTVQKE